MRRSHFVLVTAVALLLSLPAKHARADDHSPAMKLTSLGMKFEGAKSCQGSKCHSKPGDDAPPTERDHEYNIWSGKDAHAKAFDTLTKPESKKIGDAMKIADVKTSNACLMCHALSVPDNLKGDKFNIKEGNTCASCHGPSEKWNKPHAETKGWTEEQRKKSGSHEALLKTWGLYDTKPVTARAAMCVSCHLSIDADMVAAGHPQPVFELDYFSEIEPKHWIDPEGFFSTKLWMAGQAAAVADSMNQLASRASAKKDAESIKAAYEQAMAHASVFGATAPTLGIDAGAWSAKVAELTKDMNNSDAAKALASMATAAMPKIESSNPDQAMTTALLNAVAGMTGLGTNFGQNGMDQQSWAISALFNSYAKGTKMPEAGKDAMNKLIESKLMPPESGELKPEDFEKGLAEVKEKLPK